jgi:hypothetical protein
MYILHYWSVGFKSVRGEGWSQVWSCIVLHITSEPMARNENSPCEMV